LFREHKVVVFEKFGTKSGGFMLLTPIEKIRGIIWSKSVVQEILPIVDITAFSWLID
jgi:hypothetical protein